MKKQKGYFNITEWDMIVFILLICAFGYGIGHFIEWFLHLFTLSIKLA